MSFVFSMILVELTKKEKVSIAFFVEVENQARHDERFTAAGRHIEQKMQGLFLAVEIFFKTEEEACEGFFLIRTEFKLGVQVVFEIIGKISVFWRVRRPNSSSIASYKNFSAIIYLPINFVYITQVATCRSARACGNSVSQSFEQILGVAQNTSRSGELSDASRVP